MNKVLEFEQKYVLDPLREADMMADMIPLNPEMVLIRQYYEHTSEGVYRFRCDSKITVMEVKKSIKIDTPYSVNSEESLEIDPVMFENGWSKSKHRLMKIRNTIVGPLPGQDFGPHTLVVDRFLTESNPAGDTFESKHSVYAIIAEVETMLDSTTKILDLQFRLPMCLRQFLLLEVDRRDSYSKTFGSVNMCDDPLTITNLTNAIDVLRNHQNASC